MHIVQRKGSARAGSCGLTCLWAREDSPTMGDRLPQSMTQTDQFHAVAVPSIGRRYDERFDGFYSTNPR